MRSCFPSTGQFRLKEIESNSVIGPITEIYPDEWSRVQMYRQTSMLGTPFRQKTHLKGLSLLDYLDELFFQLFGVEFAFEVRDTSIGDHGQPFVDAIDESRIAEFPEQRTHVPPGVVRIAGYHAR